MKIKVESEKIIKAVRKLEGIEIVLETPEDAKEAINLILAKTRLVANHTQLQLKDILVTSSRKYETSAVDYKVSFLLEFIFEGEVDLNKKAALIKQFQEYFEKS